MGYLITVAGMKRSGSTWMYNVIRIGCEQIGYDVSYSGPDLPDERGDVHIVKTHQFYEKLAEASDVVYTSFRSLPEVKASLERFNGKTPDLGRLSRDVANLLLWQLYSDHYMIYDRMQRKKLREIEWIFEHIKGGDRVNCYKVREKVDNLKPPTDKRHDSKTMMFNNHITK